MKTFSYGLGEYFLTVLIMWVFATLSVLLALSQEYPIVWWSVAGMFALWPFWNLLRNPSRFEVAGSRVTAHWVGGRSRTWELQQLVIPKSENYRGYLLQGYVDVLEHGDQKAFRFYPQLGGFRDLFEILAPGTQATAEDHRRKSWWNRELL